MSLRDKMRHGAAAASVGREGESAGLRLRGSRGLDGAPPHPSVRVFGGERGGVRKGAVRRGMSRRRTRLLAG